MCLSWDLKKNPVLWNLPIKVVAQSPITLVRRCKEKLMSSAVQKQGGPSASGSFLCYTSAQKVVSFPLYTKIWK